MQMLCSMPMKLLLLRESMMQSPWPRLALRMWHQFQMEQATLIGLISITICSQVRALYACALIQMPPVNLWLWRWQLDLALNDVQSLPCHSKMLTSACSICQDMSYDNSYLAASPRHQIALRRLIACMPMRSSFTNSPNPSEPLPAGNRWILSLGDYGHPKSPLSLDAQEAERPNG